MGMGGQIHSNPKRGVYPRSKTFYADFSHQSEPYTAHNSIIAIMLNGVCMYINGLCGGNVLAVVL